MRNYDPTTGRYIQADLLGLVDGASVYGYARGNPGRWTDFRGEQSFTDFANSTFGKRAIAAAAGAALADSPLLPFGDIAGLCILGAALVYCANDGALCSVADDCQEQYEEDQAWCVKNTSGRKYIGCIQRAEDNFFICRRSGPRKPRLPEIYKR